MTEVHALLSPQTPHAPVTSKTSAQAMKLSPYRFIRFILLSMDYQKTTCLQNLVYQAFSLCCNLYGAAEVARTVPIKLKIVIFFTNTKKEEMISTDQISHERYRREVFLYYVKKTKAYYLLREEQGPGEHIDTDVFGGNSSCTCYYNKFINLVVVSMWTKSNKIGLGHIIDIFRQIQSITTKGMVQTHFFSNITWFGIFNHLNFFYWYVCA